MLRTATRALVFVLLLATPALAIDIVTCDQTVASGDVGVLQSDLSCGAIVGVILNPKATLAMNGHTIDAATGVYCVAKKCAIQGPGSITGGTACAIQPANGAGKVTITVTGPLDIHDNACGINAANPKDLNLRLTDVTVRDNALGVSAGKIKGSNVIVTGNGSGGIHARSSITLKGCTVQGNGGIGLYSSKGAVLHDCTVTGNDPTNGFDVATHRHPRLRNSTCGHSVQVLNPPALPDVGSPTWSVCISD
jgi:hypothetical protein